MKTALTYIRDQAQGPLDTNSTRKLLADGIVWAESSARIDGTLALALQRGTEAAGRKLLDAVEASGANTMAEAWYWLRDHRGAALLILCAGGSPGNRERSV